MTDLQSQLNTITTDWEITEVAELSKTVYGQPIQLIGISAKSRTDIEVNGSSASVATDNHAKDRAFAELVERIAIVNAMSKQESRSAYDQNRKIVGSMSQADLFPANPAPTQILAKSNGVACALSWNQAVQSAKAELLERADIFASWFNGRKPLPIKTPTSDVLNALAEGYNVSAYNFSAHDSEIITTGIFAIPKTDAVPLVFGLGAANDLGASLQKSLREFVQRLGFLWEEEIPSQTPEFSPTPYFHQEYFLYPGHREKITNWLAGKRPASATKVSLPNQTKILYVDITPVGMTNFCIVKAVEGSSTPLYFGCRHMETLESDIHPIA